MIYGIISKTPLVLFVFVLCLVPNSRIVLFVFVLCLVFNKRIVLFVLVLCLVPNSRIILLVFALCLLFNKRIVLFVLVLCLTEGRQTKQSGYWGQETERRQTKQIRLLGTGHRTEDKQNNPAIGVLCPINRLFCLSSVQCLVPNSRIVLFVVSSVSCVQ
jgi:hypothetical protein